MNEAAANLVELATKPVSEAAPAGESARFEDSFEELKSEVDKASGVAVAELDWKKVVRLSTEILQKKSKDLLVASYLTRGLIQTGGYPALADGLEVLRRLLADYWDGLFPERAKGRIAAVEWLSETIGPPLEQREARASDKESLQACVERTKGIDEILSDKLGGDAPVLSPFIRALEDRLAEAEEKAAPKAQAAPAAPAAAAPAASRPEEPDLSSPAGLQRAVTRSLATLRSAATAMRRGTPSDPVPYRLARFAAWCQLADLPANTEGKTQIPPLGASPAVVERYNAMASQGAWADLLEAAETQFGESVLWLDVQRFVVMALEGLGPEYAAAHAAVREDLASFLRRFPGLVDLRFSNETAFADGETQAWIQSEVLTGSGPAGAGASGKPPAQLFEEEDEPFEDVLEHARGLAKKRRLNEGVARLWMAADRADSRRQRFLRRLATARFVSEAKEHRLAVALLESLEEEIRRFNLEEWEPNLSAEALRLYLVSQQVMVRGEWKSAPEAVRRTEELFTRLARLDAAAAMKIGPG